MSALRDAMSHAVLGWVKPELDETLRQARGEIEAFVENPSDSSRMRFCAGYLHQVQGTLRMVELYAPAMVAEEMELLAQALQQGAANERDEACATLMRGTVLLPDYLERLQNGHRDIPIVLLPLLNDIRAARGAAGLSESVLFAPDLSAPLPEQVPASVLPWPQRQDRVASALARFQAALETWPEGGVPADAAELAALAGELLQDAGHDNTRRMLWVMSNVATALRDGALAPAEAIRGGFLAAARALQQATENESLPVSARGVPTQEPTRQLLYAVAQARTTHPALDELRHAFDLDTQVPSEAELDHARGSLAGRNRDLLDTVSGVVKEELLRVKDALDLHLRTGGDAASLQPQAAELTRVADTLGMLGLGVARDVVLQQRDALQAIAAGDAPASEGALLDIAGALLYVDASLDDQVARLGAGQEGGEDAAAAEARRTVEVLAHEAIANFTAAREDFVAFIETNWDHARLEGVPRLLQEVAGALRMLELPEPADYLEGVRRYIVGELIGRRRVPSGRQLDTLADAMASLEYYLEALRDRRPNRSEILEIAHSSLESLGYWPLPEEAPATPAAATGPVAIAPVAAAAVPPPVPAAPEAAPSGLDWESVQVQTPPSFAPVEDEYAPIAPVELSLEPVEPAAELEAFDAPQREALDAPALDIELPAVAPLSLEITPPAAPERFTYDPASGEYIAIAAESAVPAEDAGHDLEPEPTFAPADSTLDSRFPPEEAAFEPAASEPPVAAADAFDPAASGQNIFEPEAPAPNPFDAGLEPAPASGPELSPGMPEGLSLAPMETAQSAEPTSDPFADPAMPQSPSLEQAPQPSAPPPLPPPLPPVPAATVAAAVPSEHGQWLDVTLHIRPRNIPARVPPAAEAPVEPVEPISGLGNEVPASTADAAAAEPVEAPVVEAAFEQPSTPEAPAALEDAALEADAAVPEQVSAPVSSASGFADTLQVAASHAGPVLGVASGTIFGGFDENQDIDADIREVFLEEFEEERANLARLLPLWRMAPADLDRLRPIRRVFHTLKGSGRLVGASALGEFAWKIESMLNRVLDGTRPPSEAVIAMVQRASEALPGFDAALRGQASLGMDLRGLEHVAERVAAGEEAFYSTPAVAKSVPVAAQPEPVSPLVAEGTPASVDSVLREILETEVTTHLETVDAWIAAAQQMPQPLTDPVLRAMHTMNGAFAMTDVPEITSITDPAETFIKRALAAGHLPEPEAVQALADTAATIRACILALQAESPRIPSYASLSARLRALADSLPEARWPQPVDFDGLDDLDAPVAAAPVQVSFDPAMELTGVDLSGFLVEAMASAGPDAHDADPAQDAETAQDPAVSEAVIGAPSVTDEALEPAEADEASAWRLDGEEAGYDITPSAAATADTPDTAFEVERGAAHDLAAEDSAAAAGAHALPDAEASAEWMPDAEDAIAGEPAGSAGLAGDTDAAAFAISDGEVAAGANTADVDEAMPATAGLDAPTLTATDADDGMALSAALEQSGDAAVLAGADVTADAVDAGLPELVDAGYDWSTDATVVTADADAPATLEPANEAGEADAGMAEATPELSTGQAQNEDAGASFEMEAADIAPEQEASAEEAVVPAALDADQEGEVTVEAAADPYAIADTGEAVPLDEPAVEAEADAVDLAAAGAGIVAAQSTADEPAEAVQAPVEHTAAQQPASEAELPMLDFNELDRDLVDIFVEEGGDLLDHVDSLLVELRADPGAREAIIGLQRDLHTLKGGARMAGIASIGDLGHVIESLLEAVAEQRTVLDRDDVHLLERGFDTLHQLLVKTRAHRTTAMPQALIAGFEARIRGEAYVPPVEAEAAVPVEMVGADAPTVDVEPVAEAPAELAMPTQDSAAVPQETPAPVMAAEPAPLSPSAAALAPLSAPVQDETPAVAEDATARAPQEQVRVRADLLDNLVNHAGEVAIYRARLEQQLGAFRSALAELDRTNARLRDQLRRLDLETEAQIVARYQREQDSADPTFDPLELDRFSTLQQLSRALNESSADLTGLQGVLDDLSRQYDVLLQQQSRVSSDLQDGLMSARMVPFDSVVPRLRRVVRQAGHDTGKLVQLRLDGTHGELDRNVLDRMVAPIEHMLRNSVAHGLETPAERSSAGKAEEGTITISLRHEGSEIVLQVADDGRGLDREAIRRRAEQRGLLKPGAVLTDAELDSLIFEAGFSTSEQVSQLAGRGVGMDVVRNEVRQLGGTVEIDSVVGRGVVFTLRLPQTLAVTQAVFVQIGDTTYAVPVASVSGIGRISRERFESGTGGYRYAGEEYVLHDLGLLVGQGPAKAEGQAQVPLLLVRAGDLRAAVAIDQVVGNREIVVKPVGLQIASVPGIYGATITGDGRVVVILDVAPLVRRHLAQPERPAAQAESQQQRHVPLVMVVDDSLTMRKVTGRVLERHNFEVATARDGVEALERLEERVPDLMLLDIEMPRMDGYELATAMRADGRFRDVPIVMITSRTGDKHRQRAFEIGVQRYLGKPYQELDLMRNVYDLLGIARARD